ncbi:type IV secretion system protein VirB6 [Roseivivax marinus]|uniref:type IV secretion system protein n=1 Tax=Roseivivax marinus TaxID=1379903 RepID=UPI0008BBBDE2|nr:type IV secretion system protein [Roseivivax marinus]SEK40074.1 type IV secretion system protein VirB6 [Roseivivax marinus]
MGVVTFITEAADQALATVAASQFAAVAGAVGSTIMIASTLAIVLLFINMALQIRPMDSAEVLKLLFKITLIGMFAMDWVRFSEVSTAITESIEAIAGSIVASITGQSATGGYAAQFDDMIAELSNYANAIGQNLNWMTGALMDVLMTGFLAVLGGIAAVVLVLAKMVMALLIGLAPVMIACSLFQVTHDYFKRWLSALLSWSLYPLVIASIFSLVFGLVSVMQTRLGDATSITHIGAAIPFLAVMLLSLVMVLFIPAIVRTLSGDINAGLAAAAAGSLATGLARGAAQAPRPKPQPEGPGGGSSGTSAAASQRSSQTSTASRVARTMERNKRLGNA